jgi:Flp pilus assembly protein TadG
MVGLKQIGRLARSGVRLLRNAARDRSGGVTVIVALTLPMMLGASALAVEYSHVLAVQVEDQQASDAAAYAGALAYNATNSTASMSSAASAAAALNGIPTNANVTTTLVNSPSGDGNQSVQVTVVRPNEMYLPALFGQATNLNINTKSYAELGGGAPGCVIALKASGSGVSVSGASQISAPSCAVASNAGINTAGSGCVTAKAATYNSSGAPTSGCSPNGVTSSSITKKAVTDPLAGNAGVAASQAHLTTVQSMGSPSVSSQTGGTAIQFRGTITASQLPAGCTPTSATSPYVVTCTGASFTWGAITTGGGVTVTINSPASAVVNFSGPVNNNGGGSSITFAGGATYNMSQGVLNTSGSGGVTFPAATFNIGQSTTACSDGYDYSVCDASSSMTFGGPSTFALASGIYVKGGSTFTMGAGTGNSFQIGKATSGYGLYTSGGSTVKFADATGGLFQMNGNFSNSGGGSCTSVGASTNHDIHGYMLVTGGVILGAGIYTVTNYVDIGGSNGGDVTCWGATTGVNAQNVTLVIGGASSFTGCPTSGDVFCVAAGYADNTMTAPTSGTMANLLVIGPQSSSNTGSADFGNGATNTTVSGAFYMPNGAVNLSGAATVGNNATCFELIGTQVTLSGGTAIGTPCSNMGGAAIGSSVKLVK